MDGSAGTSDESGISRLYLCERARRHSLDLRIKAQLEVMGEIHEKLEKMASRGQSPEATEKLVENFADKFKSSVARHKQYVQRLRYGFRHYYARHYHMGNSAEE